jgi:hypothetical protein
MIKEHMSIMPEKRVTLRGKGQVNGQETKNTKRYPNWNTVERVVSNIIDKC